MTNRGALRSNSNVTKTPSAASNASNSSSRNNGRRNEGNRVSTRVNSADYMRIGEHRDLVRIPPRERDFMRYDVPGRFWARTPHYYGYRVRILPVRYRLMRYWGIDYYYYNGIYYRPWNGIYIVCRPPFGITVAHTVADLALSPLSFAYYNSVYRTYRAIDANNRTIDEQNRIIAQNNATIAAQNNTIALNTTRANNSYTVAERLGLVQSYASAEGSYFYQDGVFYCETADGQYEVIVPPAGALVNELPDDYEIITLDGVKYYKVDDTVFTLTLVSGVPYLEVLGQMYGSMAEQYSSYNVNGTANTLNLN